MLLKEVEVNSIKENKVTLVKNFTALRRVYDFNLMSDLLEENNLAVFQKTSIGNLKDVFQVEKVSNTFKEFTEYFNYFKRLFKYEVTSKDEVDFFFSYVSQVGDTHADKEDVFIMGLHGKTIYKVFDNEIKEYEVKKGDLIFIPKGLKHKVIAMTPRIIISIGFHGRRL